VIIFVLFGAVAQIIMAITGAPMPELITLIMSPLLGLVDSIGGIIFLAVLVMILWWFGIHDSVITGPLDVFLMSNYSANMTAFAAGTAAAALPYVVTEPFWWTFMTIGGSGATLALAVLAATSKSKQIKTVGRLGLIPALFNINEPLIFGLPIMYNPTLLIPFIVAMPLNGVITYICMSVGLVSKTFSYGGWNMPAPISAFIATLDVRAVILTLALIVIDALIYLPFFKVYEKQKLAEEAAAPAEEV
jgi:PTS system cellobiose-specific IIC component